MSCGHRPGPGSSQSIPGTLSQSTAVARPQRPPAQGVWRLGDVLLQFLLPELTTSRLLLSLLMRSGRRETRASTYVTDSVCHRTKKHML